ncbi:MULTISPECIES: cyclophilin-like fold protein [Arsenicicoccus]|uniref:cyclophilin-like fold protein n=1 Tax=Arsenicicoccus TaxID=267408 RepID=UPI00257D6DAD|nr:MULTISPECIES: cyclophilin-like fold protein [Actinomycetes]
MRASATRSTPIWLVTALLAVATSACTSQPTQPAATDDRTDIVSTPTTPAPEPTPHSVGTTIRLTIGDTTIDGELWDNPAGRDLVARLPLTLTFSDYNAVEKTARLQSALTMNGMPAGDDPNPGEIGWYAPSSDLVLYYGDVGHWDGIARLGTFDARGITLLADGPADVAVSITLSDR